MRLEVYGSRRLTTTMQLLQVASSENARNGYKTYPLILGGGGDNIVHQDWHELRHPVDSGGEAAIWGGAADGLALLFGLFQPFAGYRVYNVEDTKLMCTGGFLEVGVDLLDQN